MVKRTLLLFTFTGLANLLIFLTPVSAASEGGFDPFFLLMDIEYIIAGLILGAIMVFGSYLLIKKLPKEG